MNCSEKILDENDFLNKVNQYKLFPISVTSDIKLSVHMLCDEDIFLQLASKKTSEIFYCYEYPKIHEILITAETFEYANRQLQKVIEDIEVSEEFINNLDREIYLGYSNNCDNEELDETPYELSTIESQIKSDILSYNRQVNRNALTIPIKFIAFFNDYGCLCGIYKKTNEPEWTAAEEALYSILTRFRQVIETNKTAKQEKKNELKEKLKEHLIGDIHFKISKNKMLRREYANDLWDNSQFKWIRKIFSNSEYPTNEYYLFIERVYNEMKYYDS